MVRLAAGFVRFLAVLALFAICAAPAAFAQNAPPQSRLILTIVDPMGGVLPSAKVTVTGAEPATSQKTIDGVLTSPVGVATFDNLVPGRYSIQAEFEGLETAILRDVRLRAGDNQQKVVLQLPKLQGAITVGVDRQTAAADRAQTFGTALTREQIESLSEDRDELRRQLTDLAGIDAIIRVDSFEGAALPPKAQIKSIHVTRDAFAAENHSSGGLFVDVITQPGIGPLRGGVQSRMRDSALNGQSPFAPTKGPERALSYNFNVGGTLKPEISSFSIALNTNHAYDTPIVRAALPNGAVVSQTYGKRVPRDDFQLSGLLDYALTRDQTLRVGLNTIRFTASNQGVGAYDLPERAYSTQQTGVQLRVQEAGPLGRRFFINTRAQMTMQKSSSRSDIEAPTVVVFDAFTSGGQQRAGSRRSLGVTFMSDLDYVRGIHSLRTGIQLLPEWYRSDDRSNYLGTYTFESLDAYNAGTPQSYSRRLGDPDIEYFYIQYGYYLQDDIRVRRNLTLSPGVRIEGVNHVSQRLATAPRFGITWAPFKSGRTSLRASTGIFYNWLPTNGLEQSIRLNGFHQREFNVEDPVFDPVTLDPGAPGVLPPANRYFLGPELHYATFKRVSAGIDQTINPRLRVSATYQYLNASHRWRGDNLNAPVDGARPSDDFANVIVSVSDGHSLTHGVSANANLNLARNGAAGSTSRRFDWRRMTVTGNYSFSRDLTNADATIDGIFATSASGSVEGEWGPTTGNALHRANLVINSTALRNLNASLNLNLASAPAYDIRTGIDNNGDLIFNDRPAGMGRNAARGSGQWSLNGNFQYQIAFGRGTIAVPPGISVNAPGSGAPNTVTVTNAQASRYRLQLMASIQNMTNHYNYSSYSGVMTSPFFGQPQSVLNPRRVDFGFGFTF